jgi:isopenicillin N synthase-like dioxygenase
MIAIIIKIRVALSIFSILNQNYVRYFYPTIFFNMNIPVVDLNHFTKGTAEEKVQFAKELGNAFEQVGFVSVKNHGIPSELIDDLYTTVKDFFSLPESVKRSYEIPGLAGQRGYTSFGKEHAKGSDAPDLKEFFQYGQIIEEGVLSPEPYPENVKVSSPSDFNALFHQAYRAFEVSGSALLSAIALHLDLGETYFNQHIHLGNSILRAIHYPPILHEPKSAIRAEQHEDINLITLLVGASADGLEILSKDGEWLPVKAGPGEIVVNVGDMLQRLTNDRLKSTTHRVVNPPREMWNSSRFSIPFFLHPRSNMSLACLPSCISSDHPKIYEDYTAGFYLDERLKEIGLKK